MDYGFGSNMELDTEYRTDIALTERESALLREYLQKGKNIMTALKAVFTFSMIGFAVPMVVLSVLDFFESGGMEGERLLATIGLYAMVVGLSALSCFCCHVIDRRSQDFGNSLDSGSYEVQLTTVLTSGSRWQGCGNRRVMVDYYKCDKIAGEVVPVSKKQFDRAFCGAPIKVVKLRNTGCLYGILSEEEH